MRLITLREVMYMKKKIDVFDKLFFVAVAWMLMIMVLHCAGVRILQIRGSSMKPTLHDRELVIGFMVRDTSDLQRGDVITFSPTASSQVTYIKRIIGLPGDIVEAQNDLIFINGRSDGTSRRGTGTWGPVRIDDGYIFVLGDNRSHSTDSRILGPVPMEQIVARVASG